jgi:hypothetical protein
MNHQHDASCYKACRDCGRVGIPLKTLCVAPGLGGRQGYYLCPECCPDCSGEKKSAGVVA